MIINSFSIKKEKGDSFEEKELVFSNSRNEFYSPNNSTGKTTLMRIMLYAMGFDCSGTRKVPFPPLYTQIKIKNLKSEYVINRHGDEISINEDLYMLPTDRQKIISLIFGIENIDVLNNILGCFYFDQELGWEMLNKGKVSSSISFDLNDFLRGLSNFNKYDDVAKKQLIDARLAKFKAVDNVIQYKDKVKIEIDPFSVPSNDQLKKETIELTQAKIEIGQTDDEIRQIQSTINDNKRFLEYIDEMNLLLKNDDGTVRAISSHDLYLADANNGLLRTRLELLLSKRNELKKKEAALNAIIDSQISILTPDDALSSFDHLVTNVQFNHEELSKTIRALEKEKTKISEEIKKPNPESDKYKERLSSLVLEYAKDVGVDAYVNKNDPLFGYNKSQFSGAILHMLSFSFKAALTKLVEEKYGLVLPLLIDSPQGREVKKESITKMLSVVNSKFEKNQVFISSIYQYPSIFSDIKINKMNGHYFDFSEATQETLF